MRAPRAPAVAPHDGADSVEDFAAKNGISRSLAFKEIASGRLTARKVEARTIITHEDAARWRSKLPKVKPNGQGPGGTTAPGHSPSDADAPRRKARASHKPQRQPTAQT